VSAAVVNRKSLSAILCRTVSVVAALALYLPLGALGEGTAEDLVAAAIERTTQSVRYDGSYVPIDYPRGDVPDNVGVCTDLVIRAYRNGLGVDLQRLVHEDMAANFGLYPSNRLWGLTRPDRNIDHRRVPNLQAFFSRHAETLAISRAPNDYAAGDLVTWSLPGNLPHIGIVSDRINERSGNPLIIHNIGAGPKLEDMLFDFPITGHYRYIPSGTRQ
jgi:uncharacterized protein YijF (DUF1287 family)